MKLSKRNWAMVGSICAVVCLYAGVRYGMLTHELDLPIRNPWRPAEEAQAACIERALIALCLTFNMFSVLFLIWSVVRKRHLLLPLVFILWQGVATFILANVFEKTLPYF